MSAPMTQVMPVFREPKRRKRSLGECWPGQEMGAAAAPWTADQKSRLFQSLQLAASTCVRQAREVRVITGCVPAMVGQPVAGDRRRHVDVGLDISQHPSPVTILLLS